MKIQVCTGKSCSWKFSKYITTRIKNDIGFYNWKNIFVEEGLCMWECKRSVNVKIWEEKINYSTPAKISEFVVKKMKQKNNIPKKKK